MIKLFIFSLFCKQVQIRHSSFTFHRHSLIEEEFLSHNYIFIQLAACSFDVHLWELVDPLVIGATVVMLPPDIQMNVGCVINTIRQHQVTFLLLTPSYAVVFEQYCDTRHEKESSLLTLRHVCSGGKKTFRYTNRTYSHVMPFILYK